MYDESITGNTSHDQQRERQLNLRSALQELSQARSLRAEPVPDIVDDEIGITTGTRTRRGLFTFAQRARSAARDI